MSKEIFVTGKTLPEAYHWALLALQSAPVIPCPDWNTNQKECSMTMVVEEPFAEPMISRLFFGDPRSLEQYRQEMLDGILDFEVERGNWAYTYHQRYTSQRAFDKVKFPMILYNEVNQYEFVINELKRNPYSRRAVMDIRSLEDVGNPECSCWQHAQYFIRENKLHCKILFRSNDACKATFMNAFALIQLQKRIADELGVEMGTYTHRANSFHCYERDFELLDGYCSRIRENLDVAQIELKELSESEASKIIAGFDHLDPSAVLRNAPDLTFCYVGEWDELMEDAKPEITKMVKEQKRKHV